MPELNNIFQQLVDKDPTLVMSLATAYKQDNINDLQSYITDIETTVHPIIESYNLNERQEETLINQILKKIACTTITTERKE